MGNRIFRGRRNTVDERYTRPQRLLRQPSNVDYKKLRKLILSQKLAPCFDGLEDSSSNSDLEECPICFFFYPSLNRSRCCSKGICTECFLQMNPANAIRPAQCPFCKSSSYAVEYRGARTQEEKGLEEAEEQKVIEAKIRMQYQDSQNTEQVPSTNHRLCPLEVQYPTEGPVQETNAGWMQDVGNSNLSLHGRGIEVSQFPFPNGSNERHAEFGLNLDEVMLMEAIWQSIQANCLQDRTPQQFSESYGISASQIERYGSNRGNPYAAIIGQEEIPSSNSLSGGVASAIARMAERNIVQPGPYHSVNGVQTSQIQGEHFMEHQNRLLTTLPHSGGMLQMGVGSTVDSEFYEAPSENGCIASCSSSKDDSWDSLSAHIPEGSQCSEEDLTKREEIDDTSSCSSVHTISDVSCGSPHCSEMYGSQDCSLLQNPIATLRHQYCS